MISVRGANPLKAMVLAAGLGTRLRPLTHDRAKAAVPFLNRPLIHYSLELIAASQIKEIVVNLHHQPESVKQAVTDYHNDDLTIRFSHEKTILGTAGALRHARPLLGEGDLVLINGKIYFEEALERVIRFHRDSRALVTMVLVPHSGAERFNPVILGEDQAVRGFPLRREVDDFRQAFIFTGVHVISAELLDRIPAGFSDTVRDLYVPMLEGGRVKGFVSEGYWCECSTPRRYLEKSMEVLERKGLRNLSDPFPGSRLCSVVAAPDVEIGTGCSLDRVILWPGARVGPGASLSDAILTQGSIVPSGARLSRAIVTRSGSTSRPERVHPLGDGAWVWPLIENP